MSLRRQSNNEIEIRVFEILERLGPVFADVHPGFIHDLGSKPVCVASFDACGRKINLLSKEMPPNGLGHRRADSVAGTGKEHGLRTAFQDGLHKSNKAARLGAVMTRQPFQCKAATSVKIRRAVSRSHSILPFSRAMSRSAASSCKARRPMSMASIWLGKAVRIAA